MNIEKILSLIPGDLLERLALETKVDHYAKKLQGGVVFKLLLHCILSHKDNSLRTMQSAYESLFFRVANGSGGSISIGSISERLAGIELSYFGQLFGSCVSLYKQTPGKDRADYIRFDSTIVALSSKLLHTGYRLKGGDAENYRQIKFTVGYGSIPEIVNFYVEQQHSSENVCLKATILEQAAQETRRIKIFDRGISARATYDLFTDKGIQFVSRLNATCRRREIKENKSSAALLPETTDTLTIVSDKWCQLFADKGKKGRHPVRLIEAVRNDTGETMLFVTNNTELTAVEVSELYKRRWDIEVFFKALKQLLNFKHFVNRSANGIQVVLYVTMIAAILLTAYKKENNLSGFKIAKQRFAQELEMEIVKQIITLCGGDPQRLQEIIPWTDG